MAIGQDSHRFDTKGSNKPLVLAGVEFGGEDPLEANSDGDVVLHAVTRAVSGITTVDVIGPKTKAFLAEGVTDSRVYLRKGSRTFRERSSIFRFRSNAAGRRLLLRFLR